MSEGERPGPPGGAGAPPLDETLRTIAEAGKASLGATRDSLRALRALVSADLALARSALGRGIAWAGVAIVFGASAWLLATAAGVALMQRFASQGRGGFADRVLARMRQSFGGHAVTRHTLGG